MHFNLYGAQPRKKLVQIYFRLKASLTNKANLKLKPNWVYTLDSELLYVYWICSEIFGLELFSYSLNKFGKMPVIIIHRSHKIAVSLRTKINVVGYIGTYATHCPTYFVKFYGESLTFVQHLFIILPHKPTLYTTFLKYSFRY